MTLVNERVVSMHSGGGMALNNLMLRDPSGSLLQADRLELLDCVYHFGKDAKNLDPRYFTEDRVADWIKTANGKAARQVLFYQGTNDVSRAKVMEKAFPAVGGVARFRLVEMSKQKPIDDTINPIIEDANGKKHPPAHNFKPDHHYRTTGQFLGAKPPP